MALIIKARKIFGNDRFSKLIFKFHDHKLKKMRSKKPVRKSSKQKRSAIKWNEKKFLV